MSTFKIFFKEKEKIKQKDRHTEVNILNLLHRDDNIQKWEAQQIRRTINL